MSKDIFSLISQKYLKNNLMLVMLIGLGKAISLIWKSILLKQNIELVGIIEVLLTTLGLLTALTTLAIPAAFARFSLKNRLKILQYKNFALKQIGKIFIIMVLAISLVALTAKAFYQQVFIISSVAFSLLLLTNVIQELFLTYINVEKKFILYGCLKFIAQPLLKIGLLSLVIAQFLQQSVLFNHVIWSIIITTVITTIILKIKTSFFKPVIKKLNIIEQQEFLTYTKFLSGSFLSFIIYGAIDIYLIQYFLGNFYVGIYSAIFMFVNILDLVFSPFLQTFQVYLADKKNIFYKKKFTQKAVIGLLFSGLLIGLPISLLIPSFFEFFLNEKIYLTTTLIFVISKIIHSAVVLIIRHYLDFEGKEQFTFKTMNIALISKTVLGILLISKLGIFGLAISQLITEIVHLLILKTQAAFIFKKDYLKFDQPFSPKNS
ncbi:MAG: lipopolysaccharide biosynthesis protein [Patescibacteria group bacterium]